jgi:membrane protein
MPTWSDRVPARVRRAAQPFTPLYRAFQLWSDADGLRMSAAMSFYGVLSLAPLLLFLVAFLGWWVDREALESGMIAQISTVVGERGAAVIKETLASAQEPKEGLVASVFGLGVLLFGATGVFGELQSAFERVWVHGNPAPVATPWWHTASLRLRGVGYVLVFGFLLLVSTALSTFLNLFTGWAGGLLALESVVRLLNELVAFGICTALFVGLMRMSAGPKPQLRFLALGACFGAVLFTVGRQLLAVYLSTAAVVSAYGAAGSFIVLLMWIFFSSAVLLFAAACAKAAQEYRRERDAKVVASGVTAAGGPPRPVNDPGVVGAGRAG